MSIIYHKTNQNFTQKIATILALRLTKRFLQNKLYYNNFIKSGKIYFRIKVSFKDAPNIVTSARILKVKSSMLILLASSFQLEERERAAIMDRVKYEPIMAPTSTTCRQPDQKPLQERPPYARKEAESESDLNQV